MSLQYKAYLADPNCPKRTKEIRRFAIDQDVTSNYSYLTKKISSVFPNLAEGSFTLQWKDEEGDMVSFSSDDELMQALASVNDGIFKLYITEACQPTSGEESSPQGRPWGGKGRGGRCGRPEWYQHQPFPGAWGQYPHPEPSGFPWGPPPSFANCQQQQQQTGTDNAAAEGTYLQSVGQAVAGMLRPFGIDVDIDVENRGKKQKCKKGGKNKKKQEQNTEGASTSKPNEGKTDIDMEVTPPAKQDEPKSQENEAMDEVTPQAIVESPKPSEESEWTVVQDKEEPSAPVVEEPQETIPASADPRLSEPLTQMLSMGFNNNDGWLAALLADNDYSIARVLEVMQRSAQQGGYFRA